MFEAIKWNCVYGFGGKMMYFMLESRKGTTNEMVYRQLYRDFFVTCGLNLMDGESKKKTIKIGKFHISSQPDLRCCIGEITELDMRTVIFVGEVKQRRVTLPTSDDFGIEHLHPYNIVGQHGGELLLEIQDSCFERTCEIDENDQSTLVFRAMCVGTQMIFTALEMSKKHIDAIKELEGEVLDDDECIGKSPIFFTRPYNLLKAADRSELYESLLRIACYQKKI